MDSLVRTPICWPGLDISLKFKLNAIRFSLRHIIVKAIMFFFLFPLRIVNDYFLL